MVEKLVKSHIHSFVSKTHVHWGGKPLSIPQMLNKLVLDLQRELEPSAIGMTTKCMMTIYHIGNMVVMH